MLLIEYKTQRPVVDKNNFTGSVISILRGNKCPYSQETFEDMQKRYEGRELHVCESFDELYDDYIQPYIKTLQKPWKEVSEEVWDEMLNVLPPLRWRDIGKGVNAFAISEAYTYDLHDFFLKVKINGKRRYFAALRSIYIPDAELLADFESYVSSNSI